MCTSPFRAFSASRIPLSKLFFVSRGLNCSKYEFSLIASCRKKQNISLELFRFFKIITSIVMMIGAISSYSTFTSLAARWAIIWLSATTAPRTCPWHVTLNQKNISFVHFLRHYIICEYYGFRDENFLVVNDGTMFVELGARDVLRAEKRVDAFN